MLATNGPSAESPALNTSMSSPPCIRTAGIENAPYLIVQSVDVYVGFER